MRDIEKEAELRTAVQKDFNEEPSTAFDRHISAILALEDPCSPSEVRFAALVALRCVAAWALRSNGPAGQVPSSRLRSRRAFDADPRWMTLASSHVRSVSKLGFFSRLMMRGLDPLDQERLLHSASRPPAPIDGRAPSDALSRYQAGDMLGVWAELVALGPLAPNDYAVAETVATETMRRVRRNAERIFAKLVDIGIGDSLRASNVGPPADVDERIARCEAKAETRLPVSIAAALRHVGEVCWTEFMPGGTLEVPRRPTEFSSFRYLDPLVIRGVASVQEELDLWFAREQSIRLELREPPRVTIPDDYLKDNVSGDAYVLYLHEPAADVRLHGERHCLHFVDYLRASFRWGGFLGLETVPELPAEARKLLAHLTSDLEPF
jgi:hypothetical protein